MKTGIWIGLIAAVLVVMMLCNTAVFADDEATATATPAPTSTAAPTMDDFGGLVQDTADDAFGGFAGLLDGFFDGIYMPSDGLSGFLGDFMTIIPDQIVTAFTLSMILVLVLMVARFLWR